MTLKNGEFLYGVYGSVALSPLKTIDCTSEGEVIIHIEYKTWINAPFTGNIFGNSCNVILL
jgi:hypothetical protein